ncbi:MAG: AMP-binding protein, partial [Polaribacter sp.]
NLISDTQFEWLGRFDNVINSGGIKLYPEKIEEKLSKIIEKRFFVTGIPDKKLGEKLALVVEFPFISDKKKKSYKEKICLKIKNLTTLTKFEIPKEIYVLDSFIETDTNKIQRKKTLNL